MFMSDGQGGVRVRFEHDASASPATTGAWTQASWQRGRSGLSAGIRVTDRTSTRGAVLPWIVAERTFGATTVRAGLGRSAQFLDPVVLAESLVAPVPETALSYDVSVEQPIGRGVRVQGSVFYRRDEDLLRRVGEERLDLNGTTRFSESTFPVFSPSLSGSSKGAEFLIIRRSATGPSGWLGYTWAHTRYRDGLTGEEFDGDFDQRHTLNVFVQQRLSYRMTVSAKLRVGSSFPLVGYFEGTPDALRLSALRNQVRLPVYARLDVRANRTFTFERSRLTLFVEVMNLLNRRNLRQTDGSVRADLEAVGFVDRLLPRVPSAGVLFEF